MLERLAQAFKVAIGALLPSDATAPAYRFKFDVRLLFPEREAFSGPLIRLLMATDDARHLQRLLIKVRVTNGATPSDKSIINGELGHLFRLLCVPLFEALYALEALDKKCSGLLDAAAHDARGKASLEHVGAPAPRSSTARASAPLSTWSGTLWPRRSASTLARAILRAP